MKGVTWHLRHKKFYATITANKIIESLGSYENEFDAGFVYNHFAKKVSW